jgi:hypothetical protein
MRSGRPSRIAAPINRFADAHALLERGNPQDDGAAEAGVVWPPGGE